MDNTETIEMKGAVRAMDNTADTMSFDYEPSANARFKGRSVDLDFDGEPVDLVRINPDDLELEFTMTPALTAYWAEQYADKVEQYLRAKARLEQVEAELYVLQREMLTTKAHHDHKALDAKTRGTVKLPTDKLIEATVRSSHRYQEAREALVMAEVDQVRLKGRMEAARRKSEALTQIGLKRNAEARALMGPK